MIEMIFCAFSVFIILRVTLLITFISCLVTGHVCGHTNATSQFVVKETEFSPSLISKFILISNSAVNINCGCIYSKTGDLVIGEWMRKPDPLRARTAWDERHFCGVPVWGAIKWMQRIEREFANTNSGPMHNIVSWCVAEILYRHVSNRSVHRILQTSWVVPRYDNIRGWVGYIRNTNTVNEYISTKLSFGEFSLPSGYFSSNSYACLGSRSASGNTLGNGAHSFRLICAADDAVYPQSNGRKSQNKSEQTYGVIYNFFNPSSKRDVRFMALFWTAIGLSLCGIAYRLLRNAANSIVRCTAGCAFYIVGFLFIWAVITNCRDW